MFSFMELTRALPVALVCFFFKDTATTEIYTLSLHDALPISRPPTPSSTSIPGGTRPSSSKPRTARSEEHTSEPSHLVISYAVFCLKKKKKYRTISHLNKRHKLHPQNTSLSKTS